MHNFCARFVVFTQTIELGNAVLTEKYLIRYFTGFSADFLKKIGNMEDFLENINSKSFSSLLGQQLVLKVNPGTVAVTRSIFEKHFLLPCPLHKVHFVLAVFTNNHFLLNILLAIEAFQRCSITSNFHLTQSLDIFLWENSVKGYCWSFIWDRT